jgi:hypothetical protein
LTPKGFKVCKPGIADKRKNITLKIPLKVEIIRRFETGKS